MGNNLTDPLGSGASRTLFNGFNTGNLSVGQHTLCVGADNFGQTSESDETNNWQAIAFTVTAPPQADLVVSSLVWALPPWCRARISASSIPS